MKLLKTALIGLLAVSMLSLTACEVDQSSSNANNSTKTESSVLSTDTSVSDNTDSGAADSESSSEEESSEESKSDAQSKADAKASSSSNKTTEIKSSSSSVNGNSSSSKPNEYGMYNFDNPPDSGLSVGSLEGSWIDTGIGTEELTIASGSDIYNGTFHFKDDEAKITTGNVKLQYMEDQAGQVFVYAFYSDDGSLWNAFYADGVIPITKLDSCVGRANFSLEDKEPVKNEIEVSAYTGTYYEETAGRGSIVFTVDASLGCYFSVQWASSASETALWEFSGFYDYQSHSISYSNCVKTVKKFAEDGTETDETVYSNGTGTITIDDRGNGNVALYWYDNMENIADNTSFIRG